MLKYLKSLVKTNTGDSSKSFSLILSSLGGVLISICVSFSLIWDTVINSRITTDLDSLGLFLLCVGGYMAGGGLNKALSEIKSNKQDV